MSSVETLRRDLMLFLGGILTLGACVRHEQPMCGPELPCPADYVCDEGMCVEEPPPACEVAWRGYDFVDGQCHEGTGSGCQSPFQYDSLDQCCAEHTDVPCEGVVVLCPQEPFPEANVVAGVDLSCDYGQECCCGSCYPSIGCTANAGESFGCFYTDACLVSDCGQCAADTDCPAGQVCELGRGGDMVCVDGCREDAACPEDMKCVQVTCVTVPCPALCLDVGTGDADCALAGSCP